MAAGGPILAIALDGRNFAIAGDAESNRKLGGFENEVETNGDGTARLIKTRVPLSIDGLVVDTDDDRGDQEFIQGLADRNSFFPIAITYVAGSTYQGNAQIVGDIQYNSKNSTTTISLSGPGVLTKQ